MTFYTETIACFKQRTYQHFISDMPHFKKVTCLFLFLFIPNINMWHTFVLLKTLSLVSVKSFVVEIPGTTQCHIFLKSSIAP